MNQKSDNSPSASNPTRARSLATAILLFSLAATVAALPAPVDRPAHFSPATRTELDLSTVLSEPGAPAVVLSRIAETILSDPLAEGGGASVLRVTERRKILTEQGRQRYAQVTLPHGGFAHVLSVAARTVRPDGSAVAIPSDSIFERTSSSRKQSKVTAFVFPAVEIGAILEWRYELRIDSPLYLEPWTFQNELPTLVSEITYWIPRHVSVRDWRQVAPGLRLEQSRPKGPLGVGFRYRMSDLPSISRRTESPPMADLASRVVLVPTHIEVGGEDRALSNSWQNIRTMAERGYRAVGNLSKSTQRSIAAAMEQTGAESWDRANDAYRYVRDQIETVPRPGIFASPTTLNQVVTSGRATSIEKALLLQALLREQRLESHLVWAPRKSLGKADLDFPDPGWFHQALVRVQIEGSTAFLEPSTPRLPFGTLSTDSEGVDALVLDSRKPTPIRLPTSSSDRNRRHATIDLEITNDGRVVGTGELVLTGHRAREAFDVSAVAAVRQSAWQSWLERSFDEYQVSELKLTESAERAEVRIAWSLSQRTGLVLGDEVALHPNRPFLSGLQLRQLSEEPRSPVTVGFTSIDQIDLEIRWPRGWRLEVQPQDIEVRLHAGNLIATTDLPTENPASFLRYRRAFEVTSTHFAGDSYSSLRELLRRKESNEAEQLLFIQE